MTNKFAQRLTLAISQSGMTPAEISRKTGITEGAISSYKAGRYKAKQEYVYLLSQCLGVSPGWLMGFDEESESENLDATLTALIESLDDQQKAAALDYISFLKAKHTD